MINIARIEIDKDTIDGVVKVLKSGQIAHGKITLELENKIARLYGCESAISVSSGTAALHTALVSAGIKPGTEVITTPFTFIATANAILMSGAKPVFVDIDPVTFNINPKLITAKITPKTSAILAVDLYGLPADYKSLHAIAKKHHLKLIVDACQSIGAAQTIPRLFSLVDALCFSFYATKNITTGEGGMILTSNASLASSARRFRHQGQDDSQPYVYHQMGCNYCPTDITAALGLGQLRHLTPWTKARRKHAEKLERLLRHQKHLILPKYSKTNHVFHQFTIRVSPSSPLGRDRLRELLAAAGVRSGVYYPSILPSHPHLRKLTGYREGSLPQAEAAAKQVLSLPVHPFLTPAEISHIAESVLAAFKSASKYEKNR